MFEPPLLTQAEMDDPKQNICCAEQGGCTTFNEGFSEAVEDMAGGDGRDGDKGKRAKVTLNALDHRL